ncbi:MAG: CHAD domain-containing protein [Bacteroidales bacterium]
MRQRLETLEQGLEASLETDAEALHRARVATRRLREALPLVAPTAGNGAIDGLKDVVRDATRALGGVREIDVALTLVDDLVKDRPDLASALDVVRGAMTGERAARLDRMHRRLDTDGLQRAARALADRLPLLADDRQPTQLLADRLLDRIHGLRNAVEEAGLLYAAERLHRVRLATKKLRYVLELTGEMRVASTRRVVGELKRVQECLGRLHDLDIVAHVARQALASSSPGEPSAPVLSLLDEQIRTEHANYLALRERLTVVLDRAAVLSARLRKARA